LQNGEIAKIAKAKPEEVSRDDVEIRSSIAVSVLQFGYFAIPSFSISPFRHLAVST
jgi:hypothetical protein